MPPQGLTSAEAQRRLATDGPNELPTARKRNLLQQVWGVVSQPMIFLLVAAGTVSFFLAEPLDGAMLMAWVLAVIGISVYQDRRTENALTALRDLSSPRAFVLRDGRPLRVAGREVVRGDVALLSEGDRVPADIALVEAVNLSVDESTLSGESVPVRKVAVGVEEAEGAAVGRPGGEATPWTFSGTLVVKGHGVGVVRATGAGTELGRIGTALRTIEVERTPLQREVDRLVRIVGSAGLVAVLLVVVVYGATRGDWLQGLLAGIAAAMAMLPEEFPVVLTVFLALGAWRMSQRHVLTRRTAVIEALGSASAICVDKTGTLTANSMTVRELVVDGEVHAVDGEPLPEQVHAIAEFAVLASPVDPFDPMDRAFQELGAQHLAGTEHVHRDWTLVREYPLSEAMLALSHVWRSPDGDDYAVAAKGAPEAIADLCHLDTPRRDALLAEVASLAERGRRVLGVARARFCATRTLPTEQHDFEFEWLGLVALQDPVRPGVPGAVADCRGAGVRVLMITGDYPGTAMAVAREVGVDSDGGCITGPELDLISDGDLARRIRDVSVFARMVPEQKLRLVRALKADGEVVGMTGDGVNDAPALRAADIGIAMGAHGTDVAREAAALVITDDDFTSIVEGVRQGRGIVDNLRKAMSYIVAVHVPIFGMALLPVFLSGWPLVLLPVQIALLELIIDPACSVVFETEQMDPRVMEQRPRAAGERILDRPRLGMAALQGLVVFAAVLAVYVWAVRSGRPEATVRSVSFVALVAGNLSLILVNRSWRLSVWQTFRQRRNPALPWILAGAVSLLVALQVAPPLREALRFGALGAAEWLIAVAAGVAGVGWFEVYKLRRR